MEQVRPDVPLPRHRCWHRFFDPVHCWDAQRADRPHEVDVAERTLVAALAGAGIDWSLAQGIDGGKSDAFQAGVYGTARLGPAGDRLHRRRGCMTLKSA